MWVFGRRLDREDLIHLFDNMDIPSDPILKLEVMRTPDHMNSSDGEVFIQGIVGLFHFLVIAWVAFLINELLQVPCLNQLIQERLQGSIILCPVLLLFMVGILPPLVSFLRVLSHRERLL